MRFRLLLLVVLLARPAAAQAPDTTSRAPGATVSGVVYDSIARGPLAGAMVQLVGSDNLASYVRTAVSDSLGRFTISAVPGGRFTLGFFHPMLDSLGVEAPLREVYVEGSRPVRADLGIPSPARLIAAICGPSVPVSSAAIVGVVRDALDREPVAGVTVSGEWLELSVSRAGFDRRIARRVATTGANGWFALCQVPMPATIALVASRGADSTDFVELEIPVDGLLRGDLYLGSARTVVIVDTTLADTLVPPPRRVHAGDGRLSGTVVTAAGGKPLAGARVNITDGPQTHANERGEWTLVDAPVGTRMLEVRAVGYYPERRRVDVVPGAPPVRVALSTLQAVLDTVRIAASRVTDPNMRGFAERRRGSGVGRYLTPEDIARHQPVFTSDALSRVPGLYVDRSPIGDTVILMRGLFEERCLPAVYIDGHHMRDLSADDINDWVRPAEIAGIEVYAAGMVPAQFQPGLSGCGSIVIWTKLRG